MNARIKRCHAFNQQVRLAEKGEESHKAQKVTSSEDDISISPKIYSKMAGIMDVFCF